MEMPERWRGNPQTSTIPFVVEDATVKHAVKINQVVVSHLFLADVLLCQKWFCLM